jgi:hypothetical protein
MSTSAILDQIDAAISACVLAIGEGRSVVEYEINGRRVQRSDPAVALEALTRSRQRIAATASAASRGGIFTLGR